MLNHFLVCLALLLVKVDFTLKRISFQLMETLNECENDRGIVLKEKRLRVQDPAVINFPETILSNFQHSKPTLL